MPFVHIPYSRESMIDLISAIFALLEVHMLIHLWFEVETVECGSSVAKDHSASYADVTVASTIFDAGHPFLSACLAWCQSISAVLTIKVYHLTQAHHLTLLWLPGGQTECISSCMEKKQCENVTMTTLVYCMHL